MDQANRCAQDELLLDHALEYQIQTLRITS
jgi:hypothetical protein